MMVLAQIHLALRWMPRPAGVRIATDSGRNGTMKGEVPADGIDTVPSLQTESAARPVFEGQLSGNRRLAPLYHILS